MAEKITIDDLLAAFKEAGFSGGQDAPGMTMRELCKAWDCSQVKAKKILLQAKEANMLKIGRRAGERLDGTACLLPVYSFVFQPKKAKR